MVKKSIQKSRFRNIEFFAQRVIIMYNVKVIRQLTLTRTPRCGGETQDTLLYEYYGGPAGPLFKGEHK